ncbi:competence protein ComGC [Bacillus sp. J14TS2]|uniref:competence type IV pilus major pilin ComGC n=1 Tax=Bacillus sp. J14TS2 TaxID=2807188 RepID=UPI001B0918D9|nr:competence type IV pilus major pilin ComGC [Bacillus sp. J14TS2]GIN73562.1 competence protein ComGC [Bacillus sp. J14TS2]
MKYLRNQHAFTLIEMLIVLLVISVILLITLPNVTKHNKNINSKGCEAFVSMLQGQVQAYHIEKNQYPKDFQELGDEGYLESEQVTCPDGSALEIVNGKVQPINKPGS